MNSSPSITKITPALLKAWANIGAASKDAKNPFFKSTYATLGEVMSVVKDPLLEQGVIILQPVDGDHVETILLHESGEWIGGRMKLVCAKENDPQALGSSVTYAKRYLLQAICFVPTEDDDGEKAMGRKTKTDPNSELQAARTQTNDW